MMMGFGMGFGLLGSLLMLLFWGGLILGAVWLVRALFSGRVSGGSPEREPDAFELLASRYARGEITREQYEIMKQDLR